MTVPQPTTRRFGLTARVFGVIAGIVLLVIAAASWLSMASLRRVSDTASQRALEQSADLASQFLAGRARSLAGGAHVFVQSPYFRTLVTQRGRDDVLDQAFEAADQLDADWVFITDERGTLIAKSDEPAAGGVPMGDVPLVAGALRGQTTSGFGASGDSALFQAIGVPIGVPGSAPIGVLVATRIVSAAAARDMKAAAGGDLVFYTRSRDGHRRLAVSTIPASAALLPAVDRAVDAQGDRALADGTHPTITVDDHTFLAQGATLTTAGGEAVGGFVLLRGRESELAGFAGVRRSLLAASLLGLALALLAAYAAARVITRPMHSLALVIRRAADGDYTPNAHDQVQRAALDSAPEVGALASAVDSLLVDLRGKDALMHIAPNAPPPMLPAADPAEQGRRGRTRGAPFALSSGSPVRAIARGLERTDIGLEIGAMLANRYRIDAPVGRGGLGIVYRAHDLVIDETVAIKMLRPEVLQADGTALERLKHELRIARRVSHRNVVRTHDIGESQGVPFLSMEYVEGASLATIVSARGALPPAAVHAIALQLLRALAVTSEQGIVHGDLKPANVLVGPNGVLKVTDFGVARFARAADPGHEPSGDRTLAHPGGAVIGTPEYMAPEQLLGEAPTAASDIYAAGIILQECLVGVVPHGADTPVAFLSGKLQHPDSRDHAPLASARARLMLDGASNGTESGAAMRALIARMLEPDVERRPRSAAALYEEFAALS